MLEELSNISKETVIRLKEVGIDSIEKLALKKVEDLLKIQGITINSAVNYIQEAIDILNRNQDKAFEKIMNNDKTSKKIHELKQGNSQKIKISNKSNLVAPKKRIVSKKIAQTKKKSLKKEKTTKEIEEKLDIGYIKDLFSEEIVLRIRFLHFKLKKLELSLEKKSEVISYDDLHLIYEYIDLLNINYKSKNQNLVMQELAITSSYYDPIDNIEIKIYDIMFECARVYWVLARLYAQLSKNFEKAEDWDNAIISMVKCSRMYKSATYFSAAAVNQNEIGESLESKNLEFESEQSRIFAQSLAAIKEERQNNLILASKLYAGLSLLSRRLFYLGFDSEKIKKQLSAQADFDMAKACYLQAQALQKMEFSESSDKQSQTRLIEDLFKKAVYYFSKSEENWEEMLKKFNDLEENEKGNILFNLSIVNDNIMEIEAEILPYELIKDIKNPEPYIAVPENLAEKLPKTILYLSDVKSMDVNVELFRKYKQKNLEKPKPVKKREELLSKKTSIGRIIKQLKSLYDDNDIDVNKYTELYEKYTIKLNDIELQIQKLDGTTNQGKNNKK
ncbi:MAG: hypothetical protein ACFFBC_03000 [Promethearchaeota archaeon]